AAVADDLLEVRPDLIGRRLLGLDEELARAGDVDGAIGRLLRQLHALLDECAVGVAARRRGRGRGRGRASALGRLRLVLRATDEDEEHDEDQEASTSHGCRRSTQSAVTGIGLRPDRWMLAIAASEMPGLNLLRPSMSESLISVTHATISSRSLSGAS